MGVYVYIYGQVDKDDDDDDVDDKGGNVFFVDFPRTQQHIDMFTQHKSHFRSYGCETSQHPASASSWRWFSACDCCDDDQPKNKNIGAKGGGGWVRHSYYFLLWLLHFGSAPLVVYS